MANNARRSSFYQQLIPPTNNKPVVVAARLPPPAPSSSPSVVIASRSTALLPEYSSLASRPVQLSGRQSVAGPAPPGVPTDWGVRAPGVVRTGVEASPTSKLGAGLRLAVRLLGPLLLITLPAPITEAAGVGPAVMCARAGRHRTWPGKKKDGCESETELALVRQLLLCVHGSIASSAPDSVHAAPNQPQPSPSLPTDSCLLTCANTTKVQLHGGRVLASLKVLPRPACSLLQGCEGCSTAHAANRHHTATAAW